VSTAADVRSRVLFECYRCTGKARQTDCGFISATGVLNEQHWLQRLHYLFVRSEIILTTFGYSTESEMAVLTVPLLIVVSYCIISAFAINRDEYLDMRQKLLDQERQMRVGGKVELCDSELHVNAILMKLKGKELEIARRNVTLFPPAVHFFRAKQLIDDSEVFKIIRSMPKGM